MRSSISSPLQESRCVSVTRGKSHIIWIDFTLWALWAFTSVTLSLTCVRARHQTYPSGKCRFLLASLRARLWSRALPISPTQFLHMLTTHPTVWLCNRIGSRGGEIDTWQRSPKLGPFIYNLQSPQNNQICVRVIWSGDYLQTWGVGLSRINSIADGVDVV